MKINLAVLLIAASLVPAAVSGDESLYSRAKAAEFVAYGWIGQMTDVYTEAPKMVKTEKGFSLDRGKPVGSISPFLVDGTLKGKLPRGPIPVFQPKSEKASDNPLYKGAKVVFLLNKMPKDAVVRYKLQPGEYYTPFGDHAGILILNNVENKELASSLESALKLGREGPSRKVIGIRDKLAYVKPVEAAMLFEVLADVDPEPALSEIFDYVQANPTIYRQAALGLSKLRSSEKIKWAKKLCESKKPGLRALAVEWIVSPLEVPDELSLLTTLARDTDEMVREAVARGLSNYEPAARKPLLDQLLADPSLKVKAAAEALR